VTPVDDGRAISTTLDVAVFLLLVTAAVGTLALPAGDPPDKGAAGPTARALATTTVDVTYRLTPADPPRAASGEYDRAAHATVLDLLAEAAVESFAVDGVRPTRTHDGFRAAVREATLRIAGHRARAVRVEAVWTPYRGSPVAGRIAAGPTPPPGVDVDAATHTVSSGFPRTGERVTAAAENGGFAAVARVIAAATVTGLFDPEATRLALHGDPPVSELVERRYERTASLLGTNVNVSDADTARANARLRRALADRIEQDLRGRFDTPVAAARAVRIGTVRVRIRTWSP
jgi:hypothetical protein